MTTIHLNEEVQSLTALMKHRLYDMDAACENLERQQARLVMGWQSTSPVKFIADCRRTIFPLRIEPW